MVLEAELIERDEEIYRLQQLLFAAEAQIEKLESKVARPKKYRMLKNEMAEWKNLELMADRFEASKFDLFHSDEISQEEAEQYRDQVVHLFMLGMDLLEIAEYGDDPRNPASDDRFANCFQDFETKAHWIMSRLRRIKSTRVGSIMFNQKAILMIVQQVEKLKHWNPRSR